jgi:hypothetical protein
MNIRRGLVTAGLCAIFGALIPVSLVVAYAIFRSLNPTFVSTNRILYFLDDLREYWVCPVRGGAVFFGCSAWATYAPAGSWRFVPCV